jgi:hypothetical protein
MTRVEADEIINKLKYAFSYHRFNEPGVVAEYTKALLRLNYARMMQVIDALIEEDSSKVPPISRLIKAYRSGTQGKGMNITNDKYCATCHDRGFILLTEFTKVGEDSEGNPINSLYEFIYHCPYCAAGSQYAYDGSQCKIKSEYRIPPITEVLPDEMINGMRRENLKLKEGNERSRAERKGTKNLRTMTAGVGRDIPDARHYEDFIPGDAYEGEYENVAGGGL